jgi:hypothetical protein
MFTSLLLACSLLSVAASPECRTINDRDRRPFTNLKPIIMDADGDRLPDRLTPRTYVAPMTRWRHDRIKMKYGESHWITFDLKTGKGRTRRSIFKYQYGTNKADYWVYALVPCDDNKDGKTDLIFYSGDDTSDETIVLLNEGGRFTILSRKRTIAKDDVIVEN